MSKESVVMRSTTNKPVDSASLPAAAAAASSPQSRHQTASAVSAAAPSANTDSMETDSYLHNAFGAPETPSKSYVGSPFSTLWSSFIDDSVIGQRSSAGRSPAFAGLTPGVWKELNPFELSFDPSNGADMLSVPALAAVQQHFQQQRSSSPALDESSSFRKRAASAPPVDSPAPFMVQATGESANKRPRLDGDERTPSLIHDGSSATPELSAPSSRRPSASKRTSTGNSSSSDDASNDMRTRTPVTVLPAGSDPAATASAEQQPAADDVVTSLGLNNMPLNGVPVLPLAAQARLDPNSLKSHADEHKQMLAMLAANNAAARGAPIPNAFHVQKAPPSSAQAPQTIPKPLQPVTATTEQEQPTPRRPGLRTRSSLAQSSTLASSSQDSTPASSSTNVHKTSSSGKKPSMTRSNSSSSFSGSKRGGSARKSAAASASAAAAAAAAVFDDEYSFEGGGANDPDETRRRQFLERNRVAACRSRQKKKERVGALEQTAIDLASQNASLQAAALQLRQEVAGLRSMLGTHMGCACKHVHGYVARESQGGGIPAIDAIAGRTFELEYDHPPRMGSDDDAYVRYFSRFGGGDGRRDSTPGLSETPVSPVHQQQQQHQRHTRATSNSGARPSISQPQQQQQHVMPTTTIAVTAGMSVPALLPPQQQQMTTNANGSIVPIPIKATGVSSSSIEPTQVLAPDLSALGGDDMFGVRAPAVFS